VQEALTAIQARIVGYLRAEAGRGAPPPTYRELCERFGWSSTATARDHLKALARKNLIELSRGRARTVRLREPSVPVTRVPLLGRITAGRPDAADPVREGYVPVPSSWVAAEGSFAVEVRGDSMRDAGILDGDTVVVLPRPGRDGDIVAAFLDGETTLKRLRMRGRRAFLMPENPAYEPIEVRTELAAIQGVVVGLLRRYGRGIRRKVPG
jgi:repressor LexA